MRTYALVPAFFALVAASCAHTPVAQSAHDSPATLSAFGAEAELTAFVDGLYSDAAARWRALHEECEEEVSVRVIPGDGRGALVIEGRVENPLREPLGAAYVNVDGTSHTTTSSHDGAYRLTVPAEALPADSALVLNVRRWEYAPQRIPIEARPGDAVRADFSLCGQEAPEMGDVAALESAPPPPPAAPPAPESITNVQHAGVDEGGIVKMHGDHLVILRRGRLFTVRITPDGLTPVAAADAFGPKIDPRGAWYDELLISDDVVMVIGYSYERGGTEIGLFQIDADGGLHYRSTYHLRSADYYSSRNYASRLVDGRLVFYAPLPLPRYRGEEIPGILRGILPGLRRWNEDGWPDGFEPIASATTIYRPAREIDLSTPLALHTVTSCDVTGGEMDCRATAVFGPRGHAFYASPTSMYVWLTGGPRAGGADGASMLYRMPLDGSAPSAVGVRGSPVDQFSFLESGDEHLNVLVRADGSGQWMWSGESTAGGAALLRLPLTSIGDGREDAPESRYLPLPTPEGSTFRNRFVGDHLLYGTGSGWGRTSNAAGALYAVEWANGSLSEVAVPHGIDRIEVMGSGAVLVGGKGSDLHFSSVRLRPRPDVVDRFVLPDAAQGELRSHGFFYRPDDEDSGVLGLPVRGGGEPGYRHLVDGSASILFLADEGMRLTRLGQLAAASEGSINDRCRASCVDWYGNARPLFLRNRVFALLGYEIVEGRMSGGGIEEVRRVSFAPRFD